MHVYSNTESLTAVRCTAETTAQSVENRAGAVLLFSYFQSPMRTDGLYDEKNSGNHQPAGKMTQNNDILLCVGDRLKKINLGKGGREERMEDTENKRHC